MIYLIVHIFGIPGIPGGFRDYEEKALSIFKRYGGEVIAAFAPVEYKGAPGFSGDLPDEIQILRLPDHAGFEAFMRDPDRVSMGEERIRVIRKTDVYLSGEIIRY